MTLLLRDVDLGQIDHMAAEPTHGPHHSCSSSSWLGASDPFLAIANLFPYGGSSSINPSRYGVLLGGRTLSSGLLEATARPSLGPQRPPAHPLKALDELSVLVSSVEPHSYRQSGQTVANVPKMAGSQEGATEPHIRGLSAPRRISAVMRAAASGSAPTSRRTL